MKCLKFEQQENPQYLETVTKILKISKYNIYLEIVILSTCVVWAKGWQDDDFNFGV